ncbi:thiamine-binding protein [Halorussus caseinilyticus]|uniref:MTH1187 family thiamine-binding protein n=1 Tax=Halorussus caseinilyticus TaxID=3034025 RepID=A0ABD5WI45_9EURY
MSYETTPTDTIIEADDPTEVFAAAEAAHRSVTDERVITSLEIDDQRNRTQRRQERVASVERRLGRPAKRERQQMSERQQTAEPRQSAERKQSPAQDTRQSAGRPDATAVRGIRRGDRPNPAAPNRGTFKRPDRLRADR